MTGYWLHSASPILLLGIQLRKLHTRTRLSHHRSHEIAPSLVVWRLLVRGCCVRRAICLDQHEPSRVILVLDEIKTGNTRLFDALLRIGNRGSDEWINVLRFHANV